VRAIEGVRESRGHGLEHADAFSHNLGPDAIAAQYRDVRSHALLLVTIRAET
jgi:hypothetical protein